MKTIFFNLKLNNHKWKNFLNASGTSLYSRFSSLWEVLLSLVRMKKLNLTLTFVPRLTTTGLTVNLSTFRHLYQNKQHLVGVVFLLVGVAAIFVHQFFDFYSEDHAVCKLIFFSADECKTWCYVNWYYYLFTIRFFITILFWSITLVMFVPGKYSLSFIPFSLIHAAGWIGILHYSMSARSFETYHAFPGWQIILYSLALGFGIIMSAGHLTFWLNHRDRSNHARWPGVHKLDIDQALKNRLFDELADEYNKVKNML